MPIVENTVKGYQDEEVAKEYKELYEGKPSFKNLRSKIIAARERKCIELALKCCKPRPVLILDVPCGTGKLTDIFLENDIPVVGTDISREMMDLIDDKYRSNDRFQGLVRATITKLPFNDSSFECVTNLRLMHRIPQNEKREAILELKRISKKYIIVSYGLTSPLQEIRLMLRKFFIPGNSVPHPIKFKNLKKELKALSLDIIDSYSVLKFFSGEIILLLEKK